MGIKQVFHLSSTSHSFSFIAGETISPTILADPFKQPTHFFFLGGGGGGVTKAIGSPLRVIKIDRPVFLISVKSFKQVALNFDTGTVSMTSLLLLD